MLVVEARLNGHTLLLHCDIHRIGKQSNGKHKYEYTYWEPGMERILKGTVTHERIKGAAELARKVLARVVARRAKALAKD